MTELADEHERTMAFAEIAFGQIKALHQPASPRNYEVWYAYATGYNPSLNQSVNETLARTIATSLSMLITLVALLILGPSVIFGFTAAITLGIFVGTYSSIYMAAPILIWLKVTSGSFVPTETEMDRQERLARERS